MQRWRFESMNRLELKAIRRAVGMSQIQLARETKVSRFRIYLFEAGTIELRLDEIEAITKAVQPGIKRAQQIVSDFRGIAAGRAAAKTPPSTKGSSHFDTKRGRTALEADEAGIAK